MTNETKVLLGIGIATILVLIGGVFFLSKTSSPQTATSEERADAKLLIRDDSFVIGTSSAKVKVVEFADFQCPACGSAHPIVKRVLEDDKGKIQFVFRNFPLPQHKNAKLAALVAEAAGQQEKFWEMHDALYENQNDWGESNNPMKYFETYAEGLKLDVDKLKEAIKQDALAKKIDRDVRDGGAVGVNSTPTFFVNGRKFNGVPQYDELQKLISEEQKK